MIELSVKAKAVKEVPPGQRKLRLRPSWCFLVADYSHARKNTSVPE
jgi:hypothetical protein